MKNIDLVVDSWKDYELIDSGDNRKLERFGEVIMIRPETQAIWNREKSEEWEKAQAEFVFENGKGKWKGNNMPEEWIMSWEDVKFTLKPTAFKHVGIFPEQAENWKWIKEKVSTLKSPKVLNLFGYTGIASMVACKNGAMVTHVDSSKQSNAWAKENSKLSGMNEEGIRYILEDAVKFVERENRRGSKYEGIILDPPAFGRGADGEVWKIEESISPLLKSIKGILSNKEGSFLLLNGYAAGYSPLSFVRAVQGVFGEIKNGEFGEILLKEIDGDKSVPSGIFVRFFI